jgi:hypothetical protein
MYAFLCENTRVVYQIGIFRSVSVGISRYLPYRYRRKSRSVHFGIIFFGGNPFIPQKGGTGPLFEEKGGTCPLFDTASPPFLEKRSSRQISNTDQKYRPPSKSETGKIPIPKKLLITPWYTTLENTTSVVFSKQRGNVWVGAPNGRSCDVTHFSHFEGD